MKASVAYEGKSQKPKVKQLKWHRIKDGLYADGVKGRYLIEAQKPNRRLDIFKWRLLCKAQPVEVNGRPTSLDDLSELKAFASSYDAIPSGTVIAVNEPAEANEASGSGLQWHLVEDPRFRGVIGARMQAQGNSGTFVLAKQRHGWVVDLGGVLLDKSPAYPYFQTAADAKAAASKFDRSVRNSAAYESPTREEWEVVVHHAPSQYRNSILAMVGPGDGFEAGNKLILQGFHDDGEASNVAASIVKRYKVPVTTGPIRKLPTDANEANEAPRRRTDEERRYPLKWTDTPKGHSWAHGLDGLYYVTGPTGRPVSWLLMDPNGARLGAFVSKQEAEDEAERVEFIERRNTRTRREYRDEEAYEERNPLV